MKSKKIPGNYSLVTYTEPSDLHRIVVSFVLEELPISRAYAAFTDQDTASLWCRAETQPDGGLRLQLPDAPQAVELVQAQPVDRVELRTHHHGGGGQDVSTIVLTLSPSPYNTVLAVSHRGVPPRDSEAWTRFWSGRVFIRLGDALRESLHVAGPMLVEKAEGVR